MDWTFLVRNVGSVLTPELINGLAQEIERRVATVKDEALEEAKQRLNARRGKIHLPFAMEQSLEGCQFRVADYEKEWQAIKPLNDEHALELDGAPVQRPDVEGPELRRLARLGQMVVFVAEAEGVPIGYMFLLAGIDSSTAKLYAADLYFFLAKRWRKGWLAVRFIRFIERQLKEAGVTELRLGRVAIPDRGAMYKRLGYKDVMYISSKVL